MGENRNVTVYLFGTPKHEYSTVSGDFYFHAHVDTAAFVVTLGVTMRDWQGHRLRRVGRDRFCGFRSQGSPPPPPPPPLISYTRQLS